MLILLQVVIVQVITQDALCKLEQRLNLRRHEVIVVNQVVRTLEQVLGHGSGRGSAQRQFLLTRALRDEHHGSLSGNNAADGLIGGKAVLGYFGHLVGGNALGDCIGKVGDAVKSVADKIKSFLHFSVPDEGPLTDFESWMPDFMKGLAEGINKSKKFVEKAVSGVADAMHIELKSGITATLEGNPGIVSNENTAGIIMEKICRSARRLYRERLCMPLRSKA